MTLKKIFFDNISSTNDYAKELIITQRHGSFLIQAVAVFAKTQFEGRGRLNKRVWESVEGNFHCSYILNLEKFLISQENTPVLNDIVLKACKNLLIDITKQNTFDLKLPNDIYVKGKKICGVLTEILYPYAVFGIGINLTKSPIESSTDLVKEFNIAVGAEGVIDHLYKEIINGVTDNGN